MTNSRTVLEKFLHAMAALVKLALLVTLLSGIPLTAAAIQAAGWLQPAKSAESSLLGPVAETLQNSAPVATIEAGTSPVAEGTAVTFTVSLDQAAPADLSVSLSVVDSGGVLSGTSPTSVAFAEGDSSKTVTISTRDDDVIRATSTVTASLSGGTGYTLGTTTSASVSVTDNDTATWTLSMQPSKIAGGETATLTVAIANGKTFDEDQTLTLDATFTAISCMAPYIDVSTPKPILAKGSSSTSVTVTAFQPQEGGGFKIHASIGGMYLGSVDLSLEADPPATWAVSARPARISEGESSTITVAVTNGRTFGLNKPQIFLTVTGSASESDYTLTSSRLQVEHGTSSVSTTLTAIVDADVEGDEKVTVTAALCRQTIGSTTVTISERPESGDSQTNPPTETPQQGAESGDSQTNPPTETPQQGAESGASGNVQSRTATGSSVGITGNAECAFVRGFEILRDLVGHDIVGDCLENERHDANGDGLQRTTGGEMVWRQADNWTAFTDGYRTWINGPSGLAQRLNTERFAWEADYAPDGETGSEECEFVLGFKTLRDLIGHDIVGECVENVYHSANGDGLQRTTDGMLVWRKADNRTAFTDGYRTWINGPSGLVQGSIPSVLNGKLTTLRAAVLQLQHPNTPQR